MQMEQGNPLRTGPCEEPTVLPTSTVRKGPMDLVDPVLSSGPWFWVF